MHSSWGHNTNITHNWLSEQKQKQYTLSSLLYFYSSIHYSLHPLLCTVWGVVGEGLPLSYLWQSSIFHTRRTPLCKWMWRRPQVDWGLSRTLQVKVPWSITGLRIKEPRWILTEIEITPAWKKQTQWQHQNTTMPCISITKGCLHLQHMYGTHRLQVKYEWESSTQRLQH